MVTVTFLSLLLLAIMAAANAVMDKLWFHYDRSIWADSEHRQFWDPRRSWKNKYKADGKTPRYPGATTWLVWLTDGWHMAKTIFTACMAAIPTLWTVHAWALPWWWGVIIWLTARWIFGAVFHAFFHDVLEKKEADESAI